MTIVNKIKELREKYPYKTALVDIKTGNKLTFNHMDIKSDKICTYFEKSGFKKGDKIVVFMPMGTEFYLILLAILKMGLIAVIIDIHTEPEHMNKYCGIVAAEGIIADKMTLLKGILLKNVRKIKKKISYKKIIENSENLPVFKRKKPKKYEKVEKEIDENTPALISFTDENIENPKIVMKNQGFFLGQYNVLEKNMKFNKETKIYLLPSLLLFSYMFTGITTFISDISHMDLNRAEEIKYENIIKQINENNIQNIVLPSVIFENTADYALKKNLIFKNVQTAYITGEYVFPKVLKKIRKVFINAEIKWVYGVPGAELISMLDFEEITEEDLESMKNGKGLLAGKKMNEMELEIKKIEKEINEENDNEKRENINRENKDNKSIEEIGEISVRRKYVVKENSETDENKKWYRTGNSGYINNKGELVLLGKVEEEINIKEKRYYPLAVETAFSFCKAVRKSALTSKDGKLYLVFERNPEFKGNPETDREMEKLKEKFGIFKIIEGKIYVNKNFNIETDYKKTEETVEKI